MCIPGGHGGKTGSTTTPKQVAHISQRDVLDCHQLAVCSVPHQLSRAKSARPQLLDLLNWAALSKGRHPQSSRMVRRLCTCAARLQLGLPTHTAGRSPRHPAPWLLGGPLPAICGQKGAGRQGVAAAASSGGSKPLRDQRRSRAHVRHWPLFCRTAAPPQAGRPSPGGNTGTRGRRPAGGAV